MSGTNCGLRGEIVSVSGINCELREETVSVSAINCGLRGGDSVSEWY